MKKRLLQCVAAGVALLAATFPAHSESSEVKVARQYGIGYLQFMLMKQGKLIEKHAEAQGVHDLKVRWVQVSGGSTINDGLISGAIDIAAVGVPPLMVLWSKTDGANAVRGIATLNSYPMYLNTRNPDVRSIQDFTKESRIAVPAVKVSAQAIALQMAAAKAFGESNYRKLDNLTVSMKHPVAVSAMLSGAGGIDSHFTNQPFSAMELKDPEIHTVTNSFEIYGGPATAVVAVTSERFRQGNPQAYRAFYSALEEATELVNEDREKAAKIYLEVSGDKSMTPEEIVRILNDPNFIYTMTPNNIMQTALFMHKAGSIQRKPDSWKDLFFPEIHDSSGS